MYYYKDETGKKYGKLTVVKRSKYRGPNPKDRAVYWECICDCGGEATVKGTRLRGGHTASCGCLHHNRRQKRTPNESALRYLFSVYKSGARRRHKVFILTLEEFSSITKADCHYCGGKPNGIPSLTRLRPFTARFNGIDRIDNDGGYTVDNVVACCSICNFMKRDLSLSEFLAHIEKIHNRRI